MRIKLTPFALVALAAGILCSPAFAQEEQEQQRLEERLRELRQQMREVERELGEMRGARAWAFESPRVLAFSTNRARLGVTVKTRPDEETDQVGAVLQSVVEDGPAAKAGLQAGDIITSFNGEPTIGRYPAAGRSESEPARKLIDLVSELDEGAEVDVEYLRNGRSYTTTATLEIVEPDWVWTPGQDLELPVLPRGRVTVLGGRNAVSEFGAGDFITFAAGAWADIELVSLNPELGRYFGAESGLLVIRAPDEMADLRSGDVILNIGGREASTPSRALRILRSYDEGEQIDMEIMRDQRRTAVSIIVPERHNEFFYERRREY